MLKCYTAYTGWLICIVLVNTTCMCEAYIRRIYTVWKLEQMHLLWNSCIAEMIHTSVTLLPWCFWSQMSLRK